jgi:hypothetical protein
MERMTRKRVLALVGSPNLEKSNTVAIVSDFLAAMKEIDPHIEAEIVSLGRSGLKPCAGGWSCTAKGECVIHDGSAEIKEKMIACDLLILGSPVYVNAVSARTKGFIDRIYLWLHVLKLIGNPAASQPLQPHRFPLDESQSPFRRPVAPLRARLLEREVLEEFLASVSAALIAFSGSGPAREKPRHPRCTINQALTVCFLECRPSEKEADNAIRLSDKQQEPFPSDKRSIH